MKLKLIYSLFVFLVFASSSCKNEDEEQRLFPKVKTLEVSNITDEGAVLNGLVEEVLASNDITDCGFCYGFPDEKAPKGYAKVSLGKLGINAGSFRAQISKDLIKDQTYLVFAYIELSDKIIYGTPVSFVSKGGLGPEIESFNPQVAGWGDTIKIRGKNFSDKIENNVVKFDQVNATIVSASDTLLMVIVPLDIATKQSTIGVTTAEKTFIDLQPFQIGAPVIKSLSAKVPFGGILNIKTQNVKGKLAVFYVDGSILSSTQVSLNEYNLIIPKSYNYGVHSVKIVVFSENAEGRFHYDAPFVTDISPKLVQWNDELIIKGKNLKKIPENTRIDFFESGCASYEYTVLNDSVIKLNVPECLTVSKCKVGLFTDYFSVYSSSQLSMVTPELQSLDQNQFCIGDNITIEGKGIKSPETEWYIDGAKVNVGASFYDSTHCRFDIPETLDAGSHKLRVKIGQLESNEIDFLIKKLVIKSIGEDKACRSGRLTIYGENFARYSSQNAVIVNDTRLDVIDKTDTYIKVRFPYYYNLESNSTIVVKVGLQEVVVPDHITMIEPWEKVAVFDVGYSFGARFTIGNKFYFSSGNLGNGEFYCFNADDKSLKRIADYPGGRVLAPVCFVIGQKAYVGLGAKDAPKKFWCYDPTINSWAEIADYPSEVPSASGKYDDNLSYAFVSDQLGYVGNSVDAMYKYNPGTNQWMFSTKGGDIAYVPKNVSFSVDNRCFLFTGLSNINIREFKPVSNSWSFIKSIDYVFYGGWSSTTYLEKLNKIIFEASALGERQFLFNLTVSLKYYDASTGESGFFFPSSSVKATLFSINDGRLFSMTYDTNMSQLIFYEFNFGKYEQIKSLISENK